MLLGITYKITCTSPEHCVSGNGCLLDKKFSSCRYQLSLISPQQPSVLRRQACLEASSWQPCWLCLLPSWMQHASWEAFWIGVGYFTMKKSVR